MVSATGISVKPLHEVMEEGQRYRKLQYKHFIETETMNEYQLILFAHDEDGVLNVVLNAVKYAQVKRVMPYSTFAKAFEPNDDTLKPYMQE